MNIDILGLEAFLAIAQHGRFHKAARELHLTQTALTRRLQQFEEQLGVKLVERTTRSVALTKLGAAFLPQARRLVGELTSRRAFGRKAAPRFVSEIGRAHVSTPVTYQYRMP